jgi:hypothetical protein
VSDEDIRQIYRAKSIKSHGASASASIMKQQMDQAAKAAENDKGEDYRYRNFRDVPNFYTASVDQKNKINSSNVLRNLDMMRRISSLHNT